MKYFTDVWNDAKLDYDRKEITKEEAEKILWDYYNNADQCAETPCYYRTMFGGVEVTEE